MKNPAEAKSVSETNSVPVAKDAADSKRADAKGSSAASRSAAAADTARTISTEAAKLVDRVVEIGERTTSLTTRLTIGIASFYASRFHGRLTASGTKYDETEMTAAHRSLPFGTLLRVTNLTNLRSVIVKVTDRGPYVRGRTLDLSRRAATKLGMLGRGLAQVRIEKLDRDEAEQPDPALESDSKE